MMKKFSMIAGTLIVLFSAVLLTTCKKSDDSSSTPETCGTPANLKANGTTSSSTTLTWDAVTGAVSYNIQYRAPAITSAWTTTTSSTNAKTISSLNSGTNYEFQI